MSLADSALSRVADYFETSEATGRQPWSTVARPDQLAPEGEWFVWLLMAGRGFGKMVDLSTKVPMSGSSAGWKTIGEIQVGDQVFDESGRPCNVTAVFDGTPKVAYRVKFSDGTYIDACDEHQWITWTHAERKAYLRNSHEVDTTQFPDEWPSWQVKREPTRSLPKDVVTHAIKLNKDGMSIRKIEKILGYSRAALTPHIRNGSYIPRKAVVRAGAVGPKIRTTQDIVDTLTYGGRGDRNHCIPTCSPIDLPKQDLPVDPWLFGYWLGDGCKKSATFTSCDSDVGEFMSYIESLGYPITHKKIKKSERSHSMYVKNLIGDLRATGALSNKHVPERYLWASIDQREDLLRGLMDADGYCDEVSGHVEFCNTNKDLVDAVVHLARSLGQKPVCAEGRSVLNGVDHSPKWRVTWRPTRNPFRLARKVSRVHPSGSQSLRNHHRMIVSVDRIDPVPMRCLTVDSPHHMFLAGEGMIPTHNSRTAAEWSLIKARRFPGCRIALVAATAADIRDTMIEGESGLLACLEPDEFRGGSIDSGYNRSLSEIVLRNGSRFKGYTAEKPRKLRGPQHHFAWADEAAYWSDAYKGVVTDTTWSNLVIGTRLPPRRDWPKDYQSQIVVATTPRPVALLRSTDKDPSRAGLMQRETTVVTRGRTSDNLANLSSTYKATVVAPMLGTRLGRQELDGELLEERENALWKRDDIDAQRMDPSDLPDLVRVVVGVDPAVSDGESAAQTGIIVAGASRDGHGYVLADYTIRGTPMQAMKRAVEAYEEFQADRIVAEINNGGDYIGTLLRTVDAGVAYRPVRASRGKAVRAEPVSALYEQQRVHHAGSFPQLEDEMVMWAPGDSVSPDRMDALVWAFYDLKDLISGSWLDAYGVTTCHSCRNVFLKGDKIACPKCGARIEVEEGAA